MTLQDIYDQLAFGELRMLALGQDPTGSNDGLPVDSFIKMLPHIQLGMTALHKRFNLREETATVTLAEGQVTYVIKPGKALPSAAPDDLLQIERVYGTFRGEEVPLALNKVDDPLSIRTTSYNTLLVPTKRPGAVDSWLDETTELRVVYRADHPPIDKFVAQAAPLATEIFLPATHLEALLYYVASRVHNPIGMSSEFHEGNNYAAKFEMACQQIENWGLQIDTDYDEDRFYQDGWA